MESRESITSTDARSITDQTARLLILSSGYGKTRSRAIQRRSVQTAMRSNTWMPALLITAGLLSACSDSIPIQRGMPYGDAREALIRRGWQPHTPENPDKLACYGNRNACNDEELDNSPELSESFKQLQKNLREEFRMRGWHETLHCMPTGRGECEHLFVNQSRKDLIVLTESGAMGAMPKVMGYRLLKAP